MLIDTCHNVGMEMVCGQGQSEDRGSKFFYYFYFIYLIFSNLCALLTAVNKVYVTLS